MIPFMIHKMKEIVQRQLGLEEGSKKKRQREEDGKKNLEDEINDESSVLLFSVENTTQDAPLIIADSGISDSMQAQNVVHIG